ncbi:MAG: methylated-DNA--[protein]-cysteine S-methyltransferase [Sutterellaceae bacterium]|nr:methylated-DNA--[protein]-cysteine S-methyltransferase [Sutterellaceae bacterium]
MTDNYRSAVVHTQTLSTPAGSLICVSVADKLVACDWVDGWHRQTVQNRLNRHLKGTVVHQPNAVLRELSEELDSYFARERKAFDLDVLFLGTDFQKSVWQALTEIPYGELVTYSDIAKAIGNPKAVRAVGGAVGENPCSIVVPCHRVIGIDRTITGFGGGYEAKVTLLSLEGHRIACDAALDKSRWRIASADELF